METALIVLLVVFLLGGGGWGYSRWRAARPQDERVTMLLDPLFAAFMREVRS